MYKGSAYSGYPFLMLSDPYLPNGSMSPLVSASSPYGDLWWPLTAQLCCRYHAGTYMCFFLTNCV